MATAPDSPGVLLVFSIFFYRISFSPLLPTLSLTHQEQEISGMGRYRGGDGRLDAACPTSIPENQSSDKRRMKSHKPFSTSSPDVFPTFLFLSLSSRIPSLLPSPPPPITQGREMQEAGTHGMGRNGEMKAARARDSLLRRETRGTKKTRKNREKQQERAGARAQGFAG